jgi:hypothetical protein
MTEQFWSNGALRGLTMDRVLPAPRKGMDVSALWLPACVVRHWRRDLYVRALYYGR